jgi:hypothetical protein
MMKTIWIGADYPFSGEPWEVFGPNVQGRPNVRFIAMINAERIPTDAEQVYNDADCIIYRYAGIMFQIDNNTGEITVTCDISGGHANE